MTSSTAIAANLQHLHDAIEAELLRCGRTPGSVRLVGVSKKQPVEYIRAAIAAGLSDIGENYVQEAMTKFPQLPPVRKHFIGHIQTNKAKQIAQLFDMVHSVDRAEAALALNKGAELAGKILPVLLQINISPTERFGCPPEHVDALAELLHHQQHLQCAGVMAIAPLTTDRTTITHAFDHAARICADLHGTVLSLGMSNDWREAIRAGSTLVRIGTALFGAR